MKLRKNNKIKYVAEFSKMCVYDREEDVTYKTKVVGIDYIENGRKYSSIYDVYNGKDISDEKRYDVFLIENNIFGYGGTRVKPIYKEEGWGNDEE